MSNYQAFETLREHKARLHGSVLLGTGVELAAWSNCNDRVTQESADHHTLSLYVADGYECYQQVPGGWRNGGGPDRFCIMPRQYASTWDVRSDLSFVHLYCTDGHLRQLAEQTWDRSPAAISVEPRSFGESADHVAVSPVLLNCDWRDSANLLALSSASNLLMSHLIQRYSQLQWKLPQARGGLAPAVARRVREYIENHLDRPLLLADLAAQAGLSEYHFARMFKHATGLAPHQFVMRARLQRAEQLLRHSQQPITGSRWRAASAPPAISATASRRPMDLLRCRCGRGANRKGVQAWINNLRAWACCSSPDSGRSRESDESKAFYVEALGLPLADAGQRELSAGRAGCAGRRETLRPVAAGAGGAVLLWRRSLAGGSRGAAGVDRR